MSAPEPAAVLTTADDEPTNAALADASDPATHPAAPALPRSMSVKKREVPRKLRDGALGVGNGHTVIMQLIASSSPSSPAGAESPKGPRKHRFEKVLEIETEATGRGRSGAGDKQRHEAVVEFDGAGNGTIRGLFNRTDATVDSPLRQTARGALSSSVERAGGGVAEPKTPPATPQAPMMYSTSAMGTRSSCDGRSSGLGIISSNLKYDAEPAPCLSPSEALGGCGSRTLGRSSTTVVRSRSIIRHNTLLRSSSIILASAAEQAVLAVSTEAPPASPGRSRPCSPTISQPSPPPGPPPAALMSPVGRTSMAMSRSMMRSNTMVYDRGVSEPGVPPACTAGNDSMFQPSLSVRIRTSMETDPKTLTFTSKRNTRTSMDFGEHQGSSIFDRLTDPSHYPIAATARRSSVAGHTGYPAAIL